MFKPPFSNYSLIPLLFLISASLNFISEQQDVTFNIKKALQQTWQFKSWDSAVSYIAQCNLYTVCAEQLF